jgi:hypothetical protein
MTLMVFMFFQSTFKTKTQLIKIAKRQAQKVQLPKDRDGQKVA